MSHIGSTPSQCDREAEVRQNDAQVGHPAPEKLYQLSLSYEKDLAADV